MYCLVDTESNEILLRGAYSILSSEFQRTEIRTTVPDTELIPLQNPIFQSLSLTKLSKFEDKLFLLRSIPGFVHQYDQHIANAGSYTPSEVKRRSSRPHIFAWFASGHYNPKIEVINVDEFIEEYLERLMPLEETFIQPLFATRPFLKEKYEKLKCR